MPPFFQGVGCYSQCFGEGTCFTGFCGTDGICCRADQLREVHSGCGYGMGKRGSHTCTKGGPDPEYANLGERTCYGKRDRYGQEYKEGKNPYCGTKGLCCRHNQLKDKNSGCKGKGIPGKGFHHCVIP